MISNKNILIAKGEGPTNVINMSLVSIIKEEKKLKSLVMGSLNGVNGIINNRFKNLNKISDNDLKLISQTPGAALGSTSLRFTASLRRKSARTNFAKVSLRQLARSCGKAHEYDPVIHQGDWWLAIAERKADP